MVRQFQIKPTFRTTFERQPQFIRILAFSFALLLFVSTGLSLINASYFAHAAAPAYRQTSQIGTPQTLLAPYYFATDAANNFYVADGDNYVIRKFSPTGDLLLKFGPGDWSDAVGEFGWVSGIDVKSNGEIYVSDGDNYRINVYSATGTYLRTFGTQGSVNPGEFDYNGHVRFAPNGDLYVADGSRVHVFDSSDNPIGQFGTAGSNPGELDYIEDIAFDTNGDIYMADNGNGRVTVFDSGWNYLRTIGQYGAYPAPNGGDLYSPGGVAVTSDGYVLVGSTNTVKWFNKNTGAYIKRMGLADASESFAPGIPSGVEDVIVSDDGNIHTIEPYMSRIQSFTPDGTYIRQFGDFGSDIGQFWGPLGVDVDASDNIYIVDSVNNRIQKFDEDRNFLLAFGTNGTGNGQFRRPRDIAVSPYNGNVYVTEWRSGPQTARVQIFDQNGNYISQFGSQGQGNGQFASSTTITISPTNGDVYINDGGHNGGSRIEVFSANGTFLRNWNPILPIDQYSGASDITFDSTGNSYITAGGSGYIFKYNPSEQLIATLGQRAARDADYDNSYGGYGAIQVADNGTMYVADTSSHHINILDNQGKLIGKIGSRGDGQNQFEWPQDLVLDSAGRLIVTDDDNSRVSIYTVDGTISAPSAPQNITAAKVSNQINLNWNAPASNGNGTVREYRIETSMLDTHAQWETYTVVPATQTSLTLSNLPADRYQVRVTAWNEAGAGTPAIVSGNIQLASPLKYEGRYELPPGQGFVAGFGRYADGSFTIPSRDLSTRFQYDTAGTFTTRLGSYGSGATQAKYYGGADTDAADNLYVADRDNVRIDKYAKDGTLIGNYSSGTNPTGVSVDRTNGHYYVVANGSIRKYTLAGVFVSTFAPAVTAPRAIDIAPDGSIYIAHQTGGVAEVAKYNTAGTKLSAFPITADATWSIAGVAVFSTGEVVISDASSNTVTVYANDGTLKGTLGYSTTSNPLYSGDYFNRFNSPENITIANDLVYVPDGRNGRIKIYSLAPAATQSVPSTPQTVTGDTSTANEITVNWVAPADDGGSAISNYALEYKLTADSTWTSVNVTPPTTSHTLSSLLAGQYDVRVSATNTTGTGDTSTPISLTVNDAGAPASAPTSPQAVTVNSSVANTIGINWQAPANDGGSAVTNYLVEYKLTADSTWTSASVNAPTTTHTLANLTAGDYEIRLSAINAIGTSPPTAITATNVVDPILPTPPNDTPPAPASSGSSLTNSPTPSAGNLTNSTDTTENSSANDQIIGIIEQSDPGKIIVTWDPPTDGSPTGYVVEYDDASDVVEDWQTATSVDSNKHRVSITLPPGFYNVRVAALMPGETPARVILGVAKVTISRPVVQGDGPATTASAIPASADNTTRNIITACTASVLAAFLFIFPIIWKKRRKKTQTTASRRQ